MAAGDKKPGKSRLGSSKPKTGKAAINQHERDIAETVGGIRQPCSGALDHRKGDVSVEGDSIMSPDRFLLDSKQTIGNTMVLAVKDVTKICREALEVNKEPGLILTFGKHPTIVPEEWALIPLEVFADMLARLSKGE